MSSFTYGFASELAKLAMQGLAPPSPSAPRSNVSPAPMAMRQQTKAPIIPPSQVPQQPKAPQVKMANFFSKAYGKLTDRIAGTDGIKPNEAHVSKVSPKGVETIIKPGKRGPRPFKPATKRFPVALPGRR